VENLGGAVSGPLVDPLALVARLSLYQAIPVVRAGPVADQRVQPQKRTSFSFPPSVSIAITSNSALFGPFRMLTKEEIKQEMSDWVTSATREKPQSPETPETRKMDFASVAASKPKESWKEKLKSSPVVSSPTISMPPDVARDANKSYKYQPGFILALNKAYGLPKEFEKSDQIVVEEVLGLGQKDEVLVPSPKMVNSWVGRS